MTYLMREDNLNARLMIVVHPVSKSTHLSVVHRQPPSSCVYTWLIVDRM